MAGLTQAQYQTQLDGWFDVMTKLQNGEEARRGDRVWKSSELSQVRDNIDWLEKKIADKANSPDGSGNFSVIGGVPTDQ